MRTTKPVVSWDDILIKGAQLARIPKNSSVSVNTRTVIGPKARQPLVIETPIFVTHMSYGALSAEVEDSPRQGQCSRKKMPQWIQGRGNSGAGLPGPRTGTGRYPAPCGIVLVFVRPLFAWIRSFF